MPKVKRADGFIVSEYKPHLTIDIDEVRDEYKKRLELNPEPHKFLVKLHGFSHFTAEAQHFIASKEVADITQCVAIVFDEKLAYYEFTKQFMDHVFTVHRFAFPINVFEDETEAVAWLQEN